MVMERLDIVTEAAKVAAAVKAILKKLTGIHGGIKGVFKAAPYVVAEVEKAARPWAGITSAEKKAMAVEAIVLLIPLPWWIPKPLARALISWAIESAWKELSRRGFKLSS